jgi:hypothetical protein
MDADALKIALWTIAATGVAAVIGLPPAINAVRDWFTRDAIQDVMDALTATARPGSDTYTVAEWAKRTNSDQALVAKALAQLRQKGLAEPRGVSEWWIHCKPGQV